MGRTGQHETKATVAETPDFYQLGTADTFRSALDTNSPKDIFYKPPTTIATLVAKRSWLGEVYLDWSSWPIVTDTGMSSTDNSTAGLTAVTFRDLRFMYDVSFLEGRRSLRFAAHGNLLVPFARTVTMQQRAFATVGPVTWNRLPIEIRDLQLTFPSHILPVFWASQDYILSLGLGWEHL